ncbi:hypothetical protein MKW92_002108 [Papaver armeniacum]|nr:hypothetical protein MKW92_002108 [Papaver armeniacum]
MMALELLRSCSGASHFLYFRISKLLSNMLLEAISTSWSVFVGKTGRCTSWDCSLHCSARALNF